MKNAEQSIIALLGIAFIILLVCLLLATNFNGRASAYKTVYDATISPVTPTNSESNSSVKSSPIPTLLSETSSRNFITVKQGLGKVIIRSGPGTNYPELGTLAEGKNEIVIGKSLEGDWWKFVIDQKIGWIYKEMVNFYGNQIDVPCAAPSNCELKTSPIETKKAEEIIQFFADELNINLQFIGESNNPNANLRKVYILKDNQGNEYQVDALTFQIIEFVGILPTHSESNKNDDEIYKIAISFAEKNSLLFLKIEKDLVFSSSGKSKSSFFFRWEYKKNNGEMMTPFLQVGVDNKGRIISYINTLE